MKSTYELLLLLMNWNVILNNQIIWNSIKLNKKTTWVRIQAELTRPVNLAHLAPESGRHGGPQAGQPSETSGGPVWGQAEKNPLPWFSSSATFGVMSRCDVRVNTPEYTSVNNNRRRPGQPGMKVTRNATHSDSVQLRQAWGNTFTLWYIKAFNFLQQTPPFEQESPIEPLSPTRKAPCVAREETGQGVGWRGRTRARGRECMLSSHTRPGLFHNFKYWALRRSQKIHLDNFGNSRKIRIYAK